MAHHWRKPDRKLYDARSQLQRGDLTAKIGISGQSGELQQNKELSKSMGQEMVSYAQGNLEQSKPNPIK